ncbi:hypothetical protein BU24DRAFT_426646 [Aaosphaeria arxii CBS 175.79]|uniref:Uncharacterized protein n=1 Tax=Aaosphaeria arxii CBS 175.79 TaxID=1450172 RepID=A0A6A5XFG6_9PLEO|nr:uncharacterized protein BU24DRAFT_426646 [Aaosphaeria arxii CBS 175.79]KAF2011571.1 hypothetical protein BU24DRAFT_426646 [Aaosphaeria arxii CBS 175.79]
MGIPYSREINAAFDQVTPLVAAGFKVLKTTKNISIVLAIIQVLTVICLAMILAVLLAILYSVNPDLEQERRELVTPTLQRLAKVSVLGILETTVAVAVGFGGFFCMGLVFVWGRGENNLEMEGNDDADKALEELDDDEPQEVKEARKKNRKAKKKNKKPEGEVAE